MTPSLNPGHIAEKPLLSPPNQRLFWKIYIAFEDKREMDYNQRLDEPEAAKVNLGNKGKRFIY